MTEQAVIEYIRECFEGVDAITASQETGAPDVAWGDTFFIYDPDRRLQGPRQFPFATIVTKDYGDFDRLSNLNRPGVYRLNLGVSKATYESMFGPTRPQGDGVVAAEHDFAAIDTLLPHPVYAPQHWVCVLNPGDDTFHHRVRPLLAEAYQIAATRYARTRAAETG